MHELALELGMTVGEIKHGRGTPMSAAELTRDWPLYFAYRKREAERQEEKEKGRRRQ